MKNQRSFLRCDHCGNIVGMIADSGVSIHCCGEPMRVLEPNTTDAAQEKHVPVISRGACEIIVDVGSAAHPMTKEHHIAWIAIAQGDCTQRVTLTPEGKPSASFCAGSEPVTVYAYCNLHGLWSAEA